MKKHLKRNKGRSVCGLNIRTIFLVDWPVFQNVLLIKKDATCKNCIRISGA